MLEYALESSVNIQDDVLQCELSHTSDEKMKSIISTIQKEQNQIIRDEKTETLIIQGVAGSGKTSIALHRIAFMLYRFKNKLSAGNVTILSPDKVFGDYISTVLPELGEVPNGEFSFVDLAEVHLVGVTLFEPDRDPIETTDADWTERVRFKSTLDFVKQMDAYLEQMPAAVFCPTDYSSGPFTIAADFIRSRFSACRSYPVKKRLKLIADDIYAHFTSDNLFLDDVPNRGAILKVRGACSISPQQDPCTG